MGKGYTRPVLALAWFSALLMPAASLQAGSYQVGVAPPTVKVRIQGASQTPPQTFEGTITNHYDLYLARGEHEAMQVVVIATDALTNAQVTISPPQEVTGAGPLNGQANAWLVGHVDTLYGTAYHNWYPDPLLTFTNTCNINAGDRVPFWIDVSTLRDATAGDYLATITVTADNSPSTNVQLSIHLWDFELPLKASLPTAFSLSKVTYGGGGALTLYGQEAWDSKGIEQQFWDLLLERRMGMTHLYGGDVESFDAITYWAARGQCSWNLRFLSNGLNLPKVTDPVLNTLYLNVKDAGLLDMSYVYGFDEQGPDMFPAMRDMFNEVHTRYPGLRTMTTARDSSFGTSPATSYLRSAVDIWVPLTDTYNQAAANQLRAEGKDMWWYTCITPSHPYINFFIEFPAMGPRLLMGLMAYKLQTGGFLYYNIANWPLAFQHGPITSGPYTNWDPETVFGSHGDGSLCCAGPDGPIPTIRMENIRDGLEDYEYLKLLGDLVTTISAIGQPTARQVAWLNSAQQLLPVPSNLVASVTSYTGDPAALDSYRTQLATAILTGNSLTIGPPLNGDHDSDGDVDQSDFGYFQLCLSESPLAPVPTACLWADLNIDTHVNGSDANLFLECLSGPSVPADPHCAD